MQANIIGASLSRGNVIARLEPDGPDVRIGSRASVKTKTMP